MGSDTLPGLRRTREFDLMGTIASRKLGVDDLHFDRHALRRTAFRLCVGLTVVAIVYTWSATTGIVDLVSGSVANLSSYINGLGKQGPAIIVAFMTLAVVASPLPSAPIAIVAGTLYGHTWGTIYVLLGAQLGATVAFLLARYVRPRRLAAKLDEWFTFRRYDSQTTLMFAVFTSRLLPFVSFDLASYAAGLTPLRFWRFSVATLLGITPASFLLAHVGGEAASLNGSRITTALALLVATGLISFAVRIARGNSRRGR